MRIKARWRFADEAPSIGCGERGVIIDQGPMWVRFTEVASGHRGRMTATVYERVKDSRLIRIERRV